MTTLRGPDPYAAAEERLAALRVVGRGRVAWLGAVCRILQEEIPTYGWVGAAIVGRAGLELVAWHGAGPSGMMLPGSAVGALAVARGETVVVGDVATEAPALARFPATRAAIAVPLRDAGGVWGVIEVASAHRGAFGPVDRALLDEAAALLVRQS